MTQKQNAIAKWVAIAISICALAGGAFAWGTSNTVGRAEYQEHKESVQRQLDRIDSNVQLILQRL